LNNGEAKNENKKNPFEAATHKLYLTVLGYKDTI